MLSSEAVSSEGQNSQAGKGEHMFSIDVLPGMLLLGSSSCSVCYGEPGCRAALSTDLFFFLRAFS